MDKRIEELMIELKKEGATANEAEELTLFAKNLSNSAKFERSFDLKIKFLNQNKDSKFRLSGLSRPVFATFLAIVLFVGFATLVRAQDSLPGQMLYPVKRATEDFLGAVSPSFKTQILIRRSDEIKKLSDPENKNYSNLNNAIKAYENELDKKTDLTTKEMEESVNNLKEATMVATDGSKFKIENILRRTEERQGVENTDLKNTNQEQNHEENSFRK